MTDLEWFYKEDAILILFKRVLGTQGDEILPSFLRREEKEMNIRSEQDWSLHVIVH